jgi:hypothetical protein
MLGRMALFAGVSFGEVRPSTRVAGNRLGTADLEDARTVDDGVERTRNRRGQTASFGNSSDPQLQPAVLGEFASPPMQRPPGFGVALIYRPETRRRSWSIGANPLPRNLELNH